MKVAEVSVEFCPHLQHQGCIACAVYISSGAMRTLSRDTIGGHDMEGLDVVDHIYRFRNPMQNVEATTQPALLLLRDSCFWY